VTFSQVIDIPHINSKMAMLCNLIL